MHDKHAAYRAQDVPSEVLGARAPYALEPQLRPGLAGGLLVPGDSVVYPPGSAALLLRRAAITRGAIGARLLHGTATGLEPNVARLADGTVVHGDAVVLALACAP